MDETKRKNLEARLKQLIKEADQAVIENTPTHTEPRSSHSGNVSVIRRRKGNPDHPIKS